MSTYLNLSKIVNYAVEQTDAQKLSKIVNYAVEQTSAQKLSKTVNYAVEQVDYGALYQDEASKRPVYRAAPTGGIPYVDMSATDAELKLQVPNSGTYTFIIYNADETFTVKEVELTSGENVAPITEDFNQLAVFKGNNIHRYFIGAVKEGMKARV